jgi:adenylate kinase
MKSKSVLVTGPPLNGRDDYLREVLKLLGDDAECHDVFECMTDLGKTRFKLNITRKNVLGLSSQTLNRIRNAAFEYIAEQIRASKKRIEIISTPSNFRIKPSPTAPEGRIQGLDEKHLALINPQLIVVFISDIQEVRRNLLGDPDWKDRVEPTLKTLAEWRRESLDLVRNYTERVFSEKGITIDTLVYAKAHPPRTLADVIVGQKPRIYLSYPITGASQESLQGVVEIKNKLSEQFVCIDPYANKDWDVINAYDEALESGKDEVEIKSTGERLSRSEVEEAIDEIRAQTVTRDYRLIEATHATVVVHLSESPSYGVMAEIIHTRSVTDNPVYVLYPFKKRPSPFFEFYAGKDHILQGPSAPEMTSKLIRQMEKDISAGKWPNWAAASK